MMVSHDDPHSGKRGRLADVSVSDAASFAGSVATNKKDSDDYAMAEDVLHNTVLPVSVEDCSEGLPLQKVKRVIHVYFYIYVYMYLYPFHSSFFVSCLLQVLCILHHFISISPSASSDGDAYKPGNTL